VNAPSSIEGKLCGAAGEERAARLEMRTRAHGAGARARAAGPQDNASMCRSCGQPAIAASPISGERERGGQRGGTTVRCIVAHKGERSGSQGGGRVGFFGWRPAR
jgi:hypothetical protein